MDAQKENHPVSLIVLITENILNANQSVLNQERTDHKNVAETPNASKNVISNAVNFGKVSKYFTCQQVYVTDLILNISVISLKISFSKIGKLTAKTKSVVSGYVQRSNLANPYGFKNELWKWAYLINSTKKTKKYNKVSSNSIHNRAITEQNRPEYYINNPDTKLEKEISIWDISYNDLLPFYVKAYQEKFIEWKNQFDACSDTVIKRRISWLYPEDCAYISIYFEPRLFILYIIDFYVFSKIVGLERIILRRK